MKTLRFVILGFALLSLILCCTGVPETFNSGASNSSVPKLLDWSLEEESLSLLFDQTIDWAEANWGMLEVERYWIEGKRVEALLDSEPQAGVFYEFFISVKNSQGHHSSFIQGFYGQNRDLAQVRINEFSPRGTGNNPERVELYVLKGGSLAGLTLAVDTPNRMNPGFVFPQSQVQEGDYILIHMKSQGSEEEVNETEAKDQCSAPHSHKEAWDFWWQGGPGLIGTDGMVLLLDRPDGPAMDGVFYSDKEMGNESAYQGFGTKSALEKALYLYERGVWFTENPSPSGAIDNRFSTSTRSLNYHEEEGQSLWFTADTRKSSFGEKNVGLEFKYNP